MPKRWYDHKEGEPIPYSPRWYFDRNLIEILKDDYSVLFMIGLQGTSKTTAQLRDATNQKEALIISQSRAKLVQLQEQITAHGFDPEGKAHIIWTLEDICSTYREAVKDEEEGLLEEVHGYRRMGVQQNIFHHWICQDEDCPFLTRDSKIHLVSMLSYDAFLTRERHDKEQNGKLLGHPRKIYIDESDGLLSTEIFTFKNNPDIKTRLKEAHQKTWAMPNPYEVGLIEIDEPVLLEEFKEEHKQLSKTPDMVRENKDRLIDLNDAMRVLEFGYLKYFGIRENFRTKENTEVVEMAPKILKLFKYVIDHASENVQVITSSARLSKNLIERTRIQNYYNILKRITYHKINNEMLFYEQKGDFDKVSQLDKYLIERTPKKIKFDQPPNPKGRTQLYALSVDRHSFSAERYKLFGKRARTKDENERVKFLLKDEIEFYIEYALKTVEYNWGIVPKRVLFISHASIISELTKLKAADNWHYRHLIYRFDYGIWHSNKMHGINAPEAPYDCVIVYGDPLSPDIGKFAKFYEILEEKNKMRRGFRLKANLPPSIRNIIVPSMLAELFEGIHRARGTVMYSSTGMVREKVPVIAISNLLTPSNPQDAEIVNKLLIDDGIDYHDLLAQETKKKYLQKRMEIELKEYKPGEDDFYPSGNGKY